MTTITTVTPVGGFKILRNATAQATTGQTDWVAVPSWAKYMNVYLNLTDVGASTTPSCDLDLVVPDPVLRDDGTVVNYLDWDGITALTAAAQVVIHAGPGITGIADDDTGSATADSVYKLNGPLPAMLGFIVTLDRAEADEGYTYSLAVEFRRGN